MGLRDCVYLCDSEVLPTDPVPGMISKRLLNGCVVIDVDISLPGTQHSNIIG